jgi:hypothetical protein
MTQPDPVMVRIAEAIAVAQRGERAAARALFARTWEEFGGERGDALHRCALAHAMADVQDDVREELRWDERALAAADALTDERAVEGGVPGGVAGFYPSLHLNLAECHRRLGDQDRAREHLGLGRAAIGALPDDGYGRMIRGGLDRLEGRLADAGPPPVQVTRLRSVG